MAALLAALILQSIFTGACEDKTPTAPTPAPMTVTGRWATDIPVQGVTTRMTWQLTQADSSVTGPVLVGVNSGTILLNGVLSGTLTGSSLAYTITVNPGGVPSQTSCAGQLGGIMIVNIGAVSTMVGPMSVISTNCSIQFPGSNLTLTRQ